MNNKQLTWSQRGQLWLRLGLRLGLAALAVCMVLKRKMNNVRQNAQANEYIVPGGLRLADSYDRYTHTTKTHTKIEQKSSSSSSSSSSCSGGGGSGRSGKF